jgi:hypothetical protein
MQKNGKTFHKNFAGQGIPAPARAALQPSHFFLLYGIIRNIFCHAAFAILEFKIAKPCGVNLAGKCSIAWL